MIDFLDKRWGRGPRSAAKSLSNFQFLFFLLLGFGHIDLVISQTDEAESASLQASQTPVAVGSDMVLPQGSTEFFSVDDGEIVSFDVEGEEVLGFEVWSLRAERVRQ